MFRTLLLAAALVLTGCSDGKKQTATVAATAGDPPPAAESSNAGQVAAPASFGVGQAAPDFKLASLAGDDVTLAEFRGKVVIVDFWATWCPPCRRAMPHFQELSVTYKDDLAVVAVSVDQEPGKVVPPFVKANGLTFDITVDPRGVETAQAWGGVQSIPTTYLVDRQGKVVKMWVGLNPKEAYEAEIQKAIASS
jgi:peroxiredoxin